MKITIVPSLSTKEKVHIAPRTFRRLYFTIQGFRIFEYLHFYDSVLFSARVCGLSTLMKAATLMKADVLVFLPRGVGYGPERKIEVYGQPSWFDNPDVDNVSPLQKFFFL